MNGPRTPKVPLLHPVDHQDAEVIDLRERMDNGDRTAQAEVLRIEAAPVTRDHLSDPAAEHLTPLSEVAEKRERLLDDALRVQFELLDQHGLEAVALGRRTVARKIAAAKNFIEDAIEEMGTGDA